MLDLTENMETYTELVNQLVNKNSKNLDGKTLTSYVDRQYGVIIVELDGAIHDRKVQKTIQRNELFRGAGIKLIVLNIADIKECQETIIGKLEFEMLELIG